jgi:hypothetical protein
MTTDSPGASRDSSRVLRYLAAGLGMVALAAVGFFYLASGLVAPLWAVIALMAIWIGLVAIGIIWFRRHPLRVLALPVAAAAIWWTVITLGERLLGWTA